MHRTPGRGANIYEEQGCLRNGKRSLPKWVAETKQEEPLRIRREGSECQRGVFDFILEVEVFKQSYDQVQFVFYLDLSPTVITVENGLEAGDFRGFRSRKYQGFTKVRAKRMYL